MTVLMITLLRLPYQRSKWNSTLLEKCPRTPPLSQHFALSEKQVLMLA